jgi:hypothetical protein
LRKIYLFGSDSVVRIDSQHPVDEVGYLFGEIEFVARVFCIVDLAVKFLICSTTEGEDASESYKGEHSQGPNISGFTAILFLLYYFRSHVAGSAAEYLDFATLLDAGTEAEVYEFGR